MLSLSLSNQQALIRFLQNLVQIPSFSGMEGSLAQQLAAEMQAVGFDEVSLDDMGNVVGRLGTGKAPHLLYFANTDTVGIGDISAWQRDPFGAIIENGLLYGRGAAEPKSSLACMVHSVKWLKEMGASLNGTLYVVGGVLGEAAEAAAVRYVIESGGIKPSWVVLGAPSHLQLYRGQRGRLELEVTVQGRACHAATPSRGTNAIYGAARIIFSLEMMAETLAEDSFLGPGTLAVTHIENIERTKNVIPDRCTFIIDRRLTLGETEAHALAEVQGLLAKEGAEGQVKVARFESVSYTGKPCSEKKSYPVWILDEKDGLIKTAVKSVQAVTGQKPRLDRWDFSTPGVYTMGYAGIPTIGFGPGEAHFAYTARERVSLADCFSAVGVYAQLAQDLLK